MPCLHLYDLLNRKSINLLYIARTLVTFDGVSEHIIVCPGSLSGSFRWMSATVQEGEE